MTFLILRKCLALSALSVMLGHCVLSRGDAVRIFTAHKTL